MRSKFVREANAKTGGNSTFTLKLSRHEFAHALGVDRTQPPHKKKSRALSLPNANGSSAPNEGDWNMWRKCGPSTSPLHAIDSLSDMHDDDAGTTHRAHASDATANELPPSMISTTVAVQYVARDSASPRDDTDDNKAEEVYEDDFEDDIVEWKKGDAIGSGSYGTVYMARDERTGVLMAVKEILIADENDADINSATKEVALLRSLRDDHVVKYLGSHVDNDAKKLYIFTEWVPGGNLEQNRKQFGSNEAVVRRFTQQILRGVAYLHAKRIVHHDIKPSNILVDQHGVVKLADFGASRLISASSSVVSNASMRGTPNYMAPEVIKQTHRGRASDIWSVGCSVLRLLTGLPFWGHKKFDSHIALLYYVAHLDALPPLPTDLSADARSFVSACLAIDPMQRPSALELLQHPFVQPIIESPSASLRPICSSSGLTATTDRVQSAPVDSFTRSPVANKRVLSTAPSQPNNLPRSRGVAAVPSAAQQVAYAELPVLPNAFDIPEELVDARNYSSGIYEASIPSFSTTVFALEQSAGPTTTKSTVSQLKQTKSPAIAPTRRQLSALTLTGGSIVAHSSASKWDEQPIETDAVRIEREQRLAALAAEKHRREEREQQFQDELAEFRRQMGHH